jgi:hypothetical protein
VKNARCPAKASEDDVDDEVMATTCSLEDGERRHQEGDDCKTESTLQPVSGLVSLQSPRSNELIDP